MIKFIAMFVVGVVMFLLPKIVSAEYCGICNEAYLSCAASGQILDRCKAERNVCNQACSNHDSPKESGSGRDGVGQWFAGLLMGLVGGIGVMVFAIRSVSTTIGQYRFFRGAMVLFVGLAVVLCLALVSNSGSSNSHERIYAIWTLSTIFVVPGLILNWLRKEAGKEDVVRKGVIGDGNAPKEIVPPPNIEAVKEKTIVELIDAIGPRIESMTVAAISGETGKTERGIRTYLTRHGIKVKDYDGASKRAQAAAK